MGRYCLVHGHDIECEKHWIYVAGVETGDVFKVGMTKNINRRMAMLRKEAPGFACLYRIPVQCEYLALGREAKALSELRHLSIRGDWFRAPFEIVRAAVDRACGVKAT